MTEAEIYPNTADKPILALGEPNQSKIYSSLTAEQLIALIVAGSGSLAASHEERPVPVDRVNHSIEVGSGVSHGYDPSTNYFEQYPIQEDENVVLGVVGNETVEEVVEKVQSINSHHGEHKIRLNNRNTPKTANDQANVEVVRGNLPNNLTATSITTNVVLGSGLPINYESHTCPHCGVQNPTIARLRQHLVSHEPGMLICPTCEMVIKRKGDMARHMKLHDEKWVSCPTCAIVFKRQDDLDKHVELHQESWDCNGAVKGRCGDNGCGKWFTRKDAMVRHCRRKRRTVKG